ncbi:site-specific integrase, partial [Vibrio parahaemolyticus]
IAQLLGHRDVSIVEKHYAKRNKVSLKKEQVKADKTVTELFKTTDENSIVVPNDIVEIKQAAQPIASDDKAFIQNLLELARAAKNDKHREQIYKIIDDTLKGGQ